LIFSFVLVVNLQFFTVESVKANNVAIEWGHLDPDYQGQYDPWEYIWETQVSQLIDWDRSTGSRTQAMASILLRIGGSGILVLTGVTRDITPLTVTQMTHKLVHL
jgi:hypothetical protein